LHSWGEIAGNDLCRRRDIRRLSNAWDRHNRLRNRTNGNTRSRRGDGPAPIFTDHALDGRKYAIIARLEGSGVGVGVDVCRIRL
jgi:hypothetical protein